MKLDADALAAISWNNDDLVPAIVQDANTREVLMMAYMNAASLQRSLELGEAVYWSRQRQELWRKGATSGNTQRLIEIRVDCDADTLLLLVEPAGPACHTFKHTCFFRTLDEFAAEPKRF